MLDNLVADEISYISTQAVTDKQLHATEQKVERVAQKTASASATTSS